MKILRPLVFALVAGWFWVDPVVAQVPGREGLTTVEGRRLDFDVNGGWRQRARAVMQWRDGRLTRGETAVLNAERRAGRALAAVSGTFGLPTVLMRFADTDSTALPVPAVYDSIMYGMVPPSGVPYTLRTHYLEASNGQFDITGVVGGWTDADSSLAWIVSPCAGNGGLCFEALRRMTDAFRQTLSVMDASTDFAAFDNDGMDGIPNSGDDDGVVDIIQFVQPAIGAECGGPAMWAHKSTMVGNDPAGGVFVTDDAANGGGFISINSYFITSGVGGPSCDDSTEIMGIGLAAHEFGHGLNLPDLYDTGGFSNGIGEWGLMGSGMYTSLASPAHLGAWSKERLGWVTVRTISTAGPYGLGPVVTGDTVMLLRPQFSNPRGEYFLLENRQPTLADTANLETGGKAGPKVGGLVIWHIDSVTVAQRSAGNSVNVGAIHGVAVVQADGVGHLRMTPTNGNRGDSGDPFPGDSARTRYSLATTPAAALNHDGSFVGFQVDAITQVSPAGPISFTVMMGQPNVVRASDTLAEISVDMVRYRRFVDFLDTTQTYAVSIDSAQVSADGKSRFVFASWSDGGAASHNIMGLPSGDSLVATVIGEHRVRVTVSGSGTIQASVSGDVEAGVFVPSDSSITMTAIPDSGLVVDSWFGDTNAVATTMTLQMSRPYDLGVWFVGALDFATTTPPAPIVGFPYQFALSAVGGRLQRVYRLVSGGLPPGIVLNSDGTVAGIATQAGVYSALVEVQSGSQAVIRELRFDATAPALDVDQVVADVMGFPSSLGANERRYLDLIGNVNGSFDIGDFLAWVDSLDAAQQQLPAVRTALGRRGGGQ